MTEQELSHQAQIKELTTERDQLQARVKELEDEVHTVWANVAKLKQQLATAHGVYTELRETLTAENNRLQSQLANLSNLLVNKDELLAGKALTINQLRAQLDDAQGKYEMEHEAYMDLFRQLSEYERKALTLPHHLKPQEGEDFEHWCKNTGNITKIALQAYLYNILAAESAENGGAK